MTELPTASTHLLSIADVVDVGPRMRRITVTGEALANFIALPGQDVVVHVSDGHGGGVSRRYTIRNLDTQARRLDLDVVMHGHGPGAAWAASVTSRRRRRGVRPARQGEFSLTPDGSCSSATSRPSQRSPR